MPPTPEYFVVGGGEEWHRTDSVKWPSCSTMLSLTSMDHASKTILVHTLRNQL
jgi:hypothetical protein